MLLFDRVQQAAWTAPAHLLRDGEEHGLLVMRKMAELIRGSPVYVLDNVATWLHERLAAFEETEPDWRELAPGACALHERMWFEWSLGAVEQEPFRGWHRLGVLLRCREVDELRPQETVPGSAKRYWQPRIAVWRSESSPPLWPPVTHRAFADGEGTVFCVGRIAGPNRFGDYFTYCTLAISLMAVALMNARNVDQEAHNVPGPGRESERSTERPTVYRTLRIKPARVPRAEAHETDEALRRHMLRGKWRLFTPERPLFGKPGFHGRYWVEPETRPSGGR
jgi:hypothetical protein